MLDDESTHYSWIASYYGKQSGDCDSATDDIAVRAALLQATRREQMALGVALMLIGGKAYRIYPDRAGYVCGYSRRPKTPFPDLVPSEQSAGRLNDVPNREALKKQIVDRTRKRSPLWSARKTIYRHKSSKARTTTDLNGRGVTRTPSFELLKNCSKRWLI